MTDKEKERLDEQIKNEKQKRLKQLKKDRDICKLSSLAKKNNMDLKILKKIIKNCIDSFSKDLYIISEFNNNFSKIKNEYEQEIIREEIKIDTVNVYEVCKLLNLKIEEVAKIRNAKIIEPNGVQTIRGKWGNCDSYTYSRKHILSQKDNAIEYLKKLEEKKEKRREKNDAIEINLSSIAEALYVLNKSAKTSRDSKKNAYETMKHDIVKRAKNRQDKIYEIKDMVINKLCEEELIRPIGYHIQKITIVTRDKYQRIYNNTAKNDYNINDIGDCDEEDDYNYYEVGYKLKFTPGKIKDVENKLLYFEICGFGFHVPETDPIKSDGLAFLGDIDKLIGSEKNIKTKLNFNASVELLKRYLDKNFRLNNFIEIR
jgi:hypothetical protein